MYKCGFEGVPPGDPLGNFGDCVESPNPCQPKYPPQWNTPACWDSGKVGKGNMWATEPFDHLPGCWSGGAFCKGDRVCVSSNPKCWKDEKVGGGEYLCFPGTDKLAGEVIKQIQALSWEPDCWSGGAPGHGKYLCDCQDPTLWSKGKVGEGYFLGAAGRCNVYVQNKPKPNALPPAKGQETCTSMYDSCVNGCNIDYSKDFQKDANRRCRKYCKTDLAQCKNANPQSALDIFCGPTACCNCHGVSLIKLTPKCIDAAKLAKFHCEMQMGKGDWPEPGSFTPMEIEVECDRAHGQALRHCMGCVCGNFV